MFTKNPVFSCNVSLFTKSPTLESIPKDVLQNPKLARLELLLKSQAKTGDDWPKTRLQLKESKAKYMEKQSKTETFGALFAMVVAIAIEFETREKEKLWCLKSTGISFLGM